MQEHILYFNQETTLPAWFPKTTISVILGAGDIIHDGITNVQEFSTFDVFFCNAWNIEGSFQKNVDYLIKNHYHQKIICVIDIHNEQHMHNFIQTFRGRFHLIDGNGGHTPHFTLNQIEKLLCVGGSAVNIYERPDSMVEIGELEYWFEHGYFKGMPSYSSILARPYKKGVGNLTEEEYSYLSEQFSKIIDNYTPGQITISSKKKNFNTLQNIAYCTILDKKMPMTLIGEFRENARIWDPNNIYEELVIIKTEPYYMLDKICLCTDSQLYDRALNLIEAIKRDIEADNIFGSYAKFRTLTNHVNSEKFDAACAL